MAQIIVRKLEESVKRKLRQRATRHGRSIEEEVRHILRVAVNEDISVRRGFGTEVAALFKGIEIDRPFPKVKIKLRIPKFD